MSMWPSTWHAARALPCCVARMEATGSTHVRNPRSSPAVQRRSTAHVAASSHPSTAPPPGPQAPTPAPGRRCTAACRDGGARPRRRLATQAAAESRPKCALLAHGLAAPHRCRSTSRGKQPRDNKGSAQLQKPALGQSSWRWRHPAWLTPCMRMIALQRALSCALGPAGHVASLHLC